MTDWTTLGEAACAVLNTARPRSKAETARHAAAMWKAGKLAFKFDEAPPERPARPDKPELLPPNEMPKRGKAGNEANRRTLLHAVAHIELNAIDLAFDIVARFGAVMPRTFSDEWVKVGDDEARHFAMVESRLKSLDSYYGDMPAHDGLWQSAMATKDSLPARLAIVPMVLEARGLDVTPQMIAQFRNVGDEQSAEVLEIIYEEEITHVATGTRWFKHLANQGEIDPEEWFQELVQAFFKGALKPPFNTAARLKAGMPGSLYEPLATKG